MWICAVPLESSALTHQQLKCFVLAAQRLPLVNPLAAAQLLAAQQQVSMLRNQQSAAGKNDD